MALTYAERAKLVNVPLASMLLNLLEKKKTNLALSADITRADELIALVEKVGPEICLLKTHIDILSDFTPTTSQHLVSLAQQHQFLIFEDRKFADIGNIARLQYGEGLYRIADWAHLINAHGLTGPGTISGLAEVGLPLSRGLLLIAELSSENNLIDQKYIQETRNLAEQFPDFVIGFISQHAFNHAPQWLTLTPGVRLSRASGTRGQQYITPEQAIREQGSDIIIVGSGITGAENPLTAARAYREAGWSSYCIRVAESA